MDMSKKSIQEAIIVFLTERFELDFANDPDLNEETHLYDMGYIDSLDSLVLLNFLEKAFNLTIDAQDLINNPINTINEMVDFVVVRNP